MGSKTMKKKIGLLVNPKKKIAADVIKRIVNFAELKNWQCVISDKSAAGNAGYHDLFVEEKQLKDTVDIVIALGGDGTMLRAARLVGDRSIPLMGINLGRLGFLTQSSPENLEKALEMLALKKYSIEKRMTLECGIESSDEKWRALNDIVISRESISRVISLKVMIDDTYLTSYNADGVIIATPTGSTAHSLSAGGPILSPDNKNILLTPICPHTLTNRPLILSKKSCIKISLHSSQGEGLITIDGQTVLPLKEGQELTIKRSIYPINLITFDNLSYFTILRQKLNWGGER